MTDLINKLYDVTLLLVVHQVFFTASLLAESGALLETTLALRVGHSSEIHSLPRPSTLIRSD